MAGPSGLYALLEVDGQPHDLTPDRLCWPNPIKIINCYREVPRADRFMKIYINHPQPTCFYPVKWPLKILSRLGGVSEAM